MSRADPLRVDWLEPRFFVDGLPGRVGMTFLPGKRGPSRLYPGRVFERDLRSDLADLQRLGVRRLVLLVEDHELERWGATEIVRAAHGFDLDVVRRPIRDGGVPKSAAEMDEIVARIDEERRRGGDVAVACVGGVGRTGTVVACALVGQGLDAAAAIGRVRATRHPQAVETADQQRFVADYAERRRRSAADQPGDERLDDLPPA